MQEDNTETGNSQDNNVYAGPTISGHRFDKKLVCVKYPGNVINVGKAVETLGGICSISTFRGVKDVHLSGDIQIVNVTISLYSVEELAIDGRGVCLRIVDIRRCAYEAIDTPNRRLELRFRPDDGYSKPACGDRHGATGFLLRIRVKRNERAERDSAASAIVETRPVDGTNPGVLCTARDETSLNIPSRVSEDGRTSGPTSDANAIRSGVDNSANRRRDRDVNAKRSNSEDDHAKKLDAVTTDAHEDRSKTEENGGAVPAFDRDKYPDLSLDKDYELPRLKVLGRIDVEFKFTNLCDYQYVPMTQSRSDPNKLECIYSLIYPTGIPSFSWLKNDVPYFLPPAAFSRMDTIQQYMPKSEADSGPENVIGKNKKCQAGFPNYIYFSTPEVPTVAPKGIETAMRVKFLQSAHLERVCQLFEERPIWSKNAIMHKTRFSSEQLKILLPSVAYYFMTGPWRIMWVKLGYDPRKDINARKYQTLDYRLKAMHGLGSTVRCKRNYSNYTLPYKSAPVSKQKPAILTTTLSKEQNPKKERHLHEDVYIYREGMIPPSRQMFYQYCDIAVAEIQQMLAKLPDPLPGIRCHEKRGWLPSGFDVQCREIINKQVRAVLRKSMNIPEDHPTSLPRKQRHGINTRLKKRTVNKGAKKKKGTTVDRSNDASTSETTVTRVSDEAIAL